MSPQSDYTSVPAMEFVKKRLKVEARQFEHHLSTMAAFELAEWCGGTVASSDHGIYGIQIDTRDGTMTASPGDWILREPAGSGDRRFYPVKPDQFWATYEKTAEYVPLEGDLLLVTGALEVNLLPKWVFDRDTAEVTPAGREALVGKDFHVRIPNFSLLSNPSLVLIRAQEEREEGWEDSVDIQPEPEETLSSQVDRLAQFIMEEIPGEPSQSQGAVDTAIRLLREAVARGRVGESNEKGEF